MQPRGAGTGHRYLTTELLGRDALGTLWRAVDTRSGATVLLRLLDDRLPVEPGRVRQAVTRLQRMRGDPASAHLALPLDLGLERGAGQSAFVAYEGFGGETLAERLERGDVPSTARALRLVAAVSDGLARAHAAWVFHGALSASNVLVDGDGVKVVDVGVGELLADAEDRRTQAATSLTDRGAADVRAVARLFESILAGAVDRADPKDEDGPRGWEDEVPAEAAVALRRSLSPYRLLRPSMADLASALAPALALPLPPDPRPAAASRGEPAVVRPERPGSPAPVDRAAEAAGAADLAAGVDALDPRAVPSAPVGRPVRAAPPPGRPPRPKRRRRLVVASAAAVIVLAAGAAGAFLLRDSDTAARARPGSPSASPVVSRSPSVAPAIERATVPVVLGKPVARAARALERAGLVLGTVTSVPGPDGIVVRSEPTQGEAVAAGVAVDLFVGDGEE
jgi:serine/threonine-protein kinase